MTTMADNKDKKVLNVPHLRFPEYSGEWECSTIGREFELYSGNTPSRLDKEQFNGNVNWISSGELKEHYIYDTKEKITEEAASCNNLRLLPIGTFVIAIYGLEAEGVRGTGSVIQKKSTISQACMAFSSKGTITNEFLYSWYKKHGNLIGLKYAQGTKQQNLSYDIIEKFKIAYPTFQEQEKLNKFIALLDERIATQSKIIDKLQSLIKGIADKLFQTARTTKPLLEFAPSITSGTDKSGSGTIPLYGSTGIIGTVKNASQKGNIVLVARVGTIGTVQYVNEPCGVSDNALIVEAGEMTKYIYHFLKTYNFTRITSGTTQPLITASSLKKAAIPTYDIESQTRIVLCLNGLEKKLDMAKQYLSDIAVMKRYLLRQMFI